MSRTKKKPTKILTNLKEYTQNFDEYIDLNYQDYVGLYYRTLTLSRIITLYEEERIDMEHSYYCLVDSYAKSCLLDLCKMIGLDNDKHASTLQNMYGLHSDPLLIKMWDVFKPLFARWRNVRNCSIGHRKDLSDQNYSFHYHEIFEAVSMVGIYLAKLSQHRLTIPFGNPDIGTLNGLSIFGAIPKDPRIEHLLKRILELDSKFISCTPTVRKYDFHALMDKAQHAAMLKFGIA